MASPEWLERDFYADLGVSSNASADELKKAYRRLARQNHPDTNPDDADAEARFKSVSEAYTVLSDPEKRAEYDQARQMAAAGGRGAAAGAGRGGFGTRAGAREEFVDLGDLFGSGGMGMGDAQSLFDRLFEEHSFGGGQAQRRPPGVDLEAELTLDFRTAVRGGTLPLQLSGPSGTRTQQVRIPAGVTDGQRIRLRGQGQAAAAGAPAGDLYVRLHIEPDPVFGREGAALTLTLPVSVPELVFGATVTVPTLDETVSVRVPPQSSPGRVLRVRGHGIPRGTGQWGDVLVTLRVALPERHGQDATEALRAYAEATADFDPRAELHRLNQRPST